MPGDKADVVMFGPKPIIEDALEKAGFTLHRAFAAGDQEAFISSIAPKVRAIAAVAGHGPVNGAIMARFPKLEVVSSFGVGYDNVDSKHAAAKQHHRHQHARRAQRGGRRYRAWAAPAPCGTFRRSTVTCARASGRDAATIR